MIFELIQNHSYQWLSNQFIDKHDRNDNSTHGLEQLWVLMKLHQLKINEKTTKKRDFAHLWQFLDDIQRGTTNATYHNVYYGIPDDVEVIADVDTLDAIGWITGLVTLCPTVLYHHTHILQSNNATAGTLVQGWYGSTASCRSWGSEFERKFLPLTEHWRRWWW